MLRNKLFWLKINRMAGEGEGEGEGDASLLGGAGDPPAGDPPADPPAGDPPGEGDQEWFLKDKYKTVEDQAKAYPELQKKLGETAELVGAPDEGKYELTMPEGLEGEFIDGDPLMAKFKETAAEMNLSQGAFDKILHSYLAAEAEKTGSTKENELKLLGDNADRRLNTLAEWGGANLDKEQFEVFRGVASTAAGVQLLESMMAKSRDHKLGSGEGQHVPATGITADGLKAMMAEKDEHGNKKMAVDPAHRAKVNQAYRDLYGDEPQKTVVGG